VLAARYARQRLNFKETHMKSRAWQSSMAAALLLGTTAAYAQAPQKSEEGRMPSPGAPSPGAQAPKSEGPAQRANPEPKGPSAKGNVQAAPEGKGQRQAEPKNEPSQPPGQRSGKGNAQAEPQEKSKGSAQRTPEQSGKGAEAQSKEKTQKGAEKNAPAAPKSTEKQSDPAQKQSDPAQKGASAPASGQRVQLSEQQRTSVHQTLIKERKVNRAARINVSINVGTRVPRSVRLAPLPAAIIAIVPEYRSYRYVMIDDRICIIEPTTYEVVEVIADSGRVAGHDDRGGAARLVLTDEERRIVMSEVDIKGDSTLALGSLSEGADVPRNAELHSFPVAVVDQVPKLRDHRYFAAEDRLAIVGPQGSKVVLVIDARR
jgi:hypothetical protein